MNYLNVPFQEKDIAKQLGAKWSPDEKAWYVPDGVDLEKFSRWEVKRPKPDAPYVKRDRIPLFVDLIPKSAWFSNLRSELSSLEWEAVKKKTFALAGHHCEACAGQGSKWPVECHERFTYNDETKTQTLTRTVALCPSCHESTHFGLANVRGRAQQAMKNLMRVTGMNESQTDSHIEAAFDDFQRRNRLTWTLDAKWLIEFVELSPTTQQKIHDHSNRLLERGVTAAQKSIRST